MEYIIVMVEKSCGAYSPDDTTEYALQVKGKNNEFGYELAWIANFGEATIFNDLTMAKWARDCAKDWTLSAKEFLPEFIKSFNVRRRAWVDVA